ncbi:cytotoxin [Thermoplasmatales archaeon ex4572_165]|nr:MAG: cytotoxin [Thermoplasmatales archaeon ex4572_165]RLF60033.1 MAG: type II toxin-antitoxin system RelE/ParE family toxin [Thermoplasmata archaeon]
MTYSVLVSRTFQRTFQKLPKNMQDKIRKHLQEQKEDPVTSRPHCNHKELQDTNTKKYRLRIGDYRIIYSINNKRINVIELIKREVGYNRL